MRSSPSVNQAAELEIVLPVYREASSIAHTLRELERAVAPLARHRFIVSVDACPDGTIDVLRQLTAHLPLLLDESPVRRGYSGAMRAGLRLASAPHVLCIDSDGQYDPDDIAALWARRHDADIISGSRVVRADTTARRRGSRAFALVYRALFAVPLVDPSSSLVLFTSDVRQRLLPKLGRLPEGFWWEFNAVASRVRYTFIEVPVRHRLRAGGTTQIYSPGRLPGVVWRQLAGLARMAVTRY